MELNRKTGRGKGVGGCVFVCNWKIILGLTANLSCEAAAQVDGAGLSLGCLEPQHDSRGEFIVSVATAGLLL